MSTIPPIHSEVLVDAGPEAAPGAGQLERAVQLTTEDDTSVAGGFLAVTVRPWQVMVTGDGSLSLR